MSEPVQMPTDTMLESLRTRQRQLELDIVALKARHDEITLTIADYMSRPRGGRRGPKSTAALNESLSARLLQFTGDDPPESAA